PYAHLAGRISIGRGCRIASMASIYGFNHGISRVDVFVKDQPLTSKGIRLHEDVWVGANAVILDGVEIGAHCVVAAGAVVTKSFGAYQIIAGNPARAVADRRHRTEGQKIPQKYDRDLKVRRLVFNKDPYDNLERPFPEDLQGWGSDIPLFRDLLSEVRPALVVEVGTWKGASAIHMAGICKELELKAEIVCVDTWLGNWQHWTRDSGIGSKGDLRIVNGFPTLYFQFLSNVLSKHHSDIITPLPLTGIAGAKLFAHYKLRPDFVYIDGDHEYESVIFDLRAWLQLVSDGGVLLGDDYEWPGVRRAVEEIRAEGAWTVEIKGNKFVVRRNKT
ncbi:MAG TPA: CmcI family methyltransferase, partial [Rhodopila sp.]